jgi:hypothetical protein
MQLTYRYKMIANKADDNAFRRIRLFNRKSVGARIWNIPLKKNASLRRTSVSRVRSGAGMQCGAGKSQHQFLFSYAN